MAFKLLATILILSVYPNTPLSQWLPGRSPPLPVNPKPLCTLQRALANRACAIVPYAQVPPPTPPLPPPEAGGHHRRHRHHHHHHRQHYRSQDEGYVDKAVKEECCRWLKQVDTVCACDMLVHLPPFMKWPLHEYKVIVGHSCDVSFECESRLGKFWPLDSRRLGRSD